jgi:hypothetical protein
VKREEEKEEEEEEEEEKAWERVRRRTVRLGRIPEETLLC